MRAPFDQVRDEQRARVFAALLVVTGVVLVALMALSEPLKNATAPQGMLSFEFAGTVDDARAIVASWDADTQLLCAFTLGLDFLFLVAYPAVIAAGCTFLGARLVRRSRGRRRLAAPAALLSWAQVLAGACDVVEDGALLLVLRGSLDSGPPRVALIAASIKFACVGAGLLWLFVAVIADRVLPVEPDERR